MLFPTFMQEHLYNHSMWYCPVLKKPILDDELKKCFNI